MNIEKSRKILVFEDHPEFYPALTPMEMLRAGVFGGTYYNQKSYRSEIPPELFKSLLSYHYNIADHRYDVTNNYYQVRAGQSQQVWEEHGWIHPQDPRGWFQWYTRFYYGRRSEDDQRQINRWRAIFRHQGAMFSRLEKAGLLYEQASNKYLKSKQTLLHWAWTPQLKFFALSYDMNVQQITVTDEYRQSEFNKVIDELA